MKYIFSRRELVYVGKAECKQCIIKIIFQRPNNIRSHCDKCQNEKHDRRVSLRWRLEHMSSTVEVQGRRPLVSTHEYPLDCPSSSEQVKLGVKWAEEKNWPSFYGKMFPMLV